MKAAVLLYLLTGLGLVAAQTNCLGSGYFCGRDLRLKYHNIYWCEDGQTNPHIVVDDCYDQCVPNTDRFVIPACVKPDQEVIVPENPERVVPDQDPAEPAEVEEP